MPTPSLLQRLKERKLVQGGSASIRMVRSQ
jgi:hypothetical protein